LRQLAAHTRDAEMADRDADAAVADDEGEGDDAEDREDDSTDDDGGDGDDDAGVYRAPRISAVPYDDDRPRGKVMLV
jgi:hypothetical protein